MVWFLLLVGIALASEVPSKSIAKDAETTFVMFGTRHGNRNPEKFLLGEPKKTSDWGYEGELELTKFGKTETHLLGKSIRKFVGKLIDDNYLPKQAKFYSSSANRCQATIQTVLTGVYNPVKWADWSVSYTNWSPVPYTIDDPMLRMYSVSDCPTSDAAWKPISEDTLPDLKELTEKKKVILNYIKNNTGWEATISSAADLADNFILMDLYKTKAYPAWIEKPTLTGYTKKQLVAEIMEFAENHQIKCADYEPCRNMMGGYWLKKVIEHLRTAGKGSGPNLVGFASHTEVTLALMKLMGYDRPELPTSAGFVIELKRGTQTKIRLHNHDPVPRDHIIYQAKLIPSVAQLADAAGWIELNAFEDAVKKYVIEDWQSKCGRTSCKTL
ncbi:unnamed protein product [Auanema sp. JU1783]|nr:unnamed protein product [Auanema sp. JU1783]